jgi:hypothetical protein
MDFINEKAVLKNCQATLHLNIRPAVQPESKHTQQLLQLRPLLCLPH